MTDTAADRDTHEPAPSSDADAANRLAAVGKADKDLVNDLTQTIGPGPLRTRLIDRLRMSHDGSHFQLVPQAIVIARDGRDVQGAIAVAARPMRCTCWPKRSAGPTPAAIRCSAG